MLAPRDLPAMNVTSASISELALYQPRVACSRVRPCRLIMQVAKPRFEILHLPGVGRARESGIRALELAGSQSEIALLERRLFRYPQGGPQFFAVRFGQFGGIAILQHLAIFVDLVARACVLSFISERNDAPRSTHSRIGSGQRFARGFIR